jgi:outer membrane protein assembly factor BamA
MIKRSPSVAALLAAASLLAASRASAQDAAAAAVKDPYRSRLVGIPFFYYTPETKLAFGAGGILNFRVGKRKDQTRASSVWAFGTYNLAKQYQFRVLPQIYFERNRFFLSGDLRYEKTPQKFYGVGNDMPSSAVEYYTPSIVTVKIEVKKKFLGQFYAGVHYDFEQMTMSKVEPGGLLESGAIPGSEGGLFSGLGASLDWDTRDGVLFPRRGVFFQLAAATYGAWTGSDLSFSDLSLDLRKYVPVAPEQILAIQAILRSGSGEVPFHKLGLLGGESLMRGYYKGRYRDKKLVAIQAEYRVMITRRVGVVGFGGLADVFPAFADFRLNELKFSVGTGVRYMVNRRDGTTVRIDLAWGERSFGLYFTAQEAF